MTQKKQYNQTTSSQQKRFEKRKYIGLFSGPLLFILLLILPAPLDMPAEAWRTAAVACLMAIFWITEALPIPATALLPLVLFPLLGITTMDDAAQPYANPLIFLFMGGFIIALGMQRWNLHRRLALNIIRVMGMHPKSIVASFMIATAFLSMWVSNTATTMMMMPIGLSVIELARTNGAKKDLHQFSLALMLGIAYAANIGGIGTLIGTPPNALLAGFMKETYGYQISFAKWLMVGGPMVLLGLPIGYIILTRFAFRLNLSSLDGGEKFIHNELKKLGPISYAEKVVGIVFLSVAFLWITRPMLTSLIPELSDANIAMLGAVVLFVIPVHLSRGEFVMDWKTAEKCPWGVLLLFGGGLSLANAINESGLATWIGQSLGHIQLLPVILIILLITLAISLLTELTSNTATAATFLPIMASLAIGIGENPLLFVIPTALAASCAFMLPVATPPNAIVYGSGHIKIPEMVRAGLLIKVLFIILATFIAYLLVTKAFHITLGKVPAWL